MTTHQTHADQLKAIIDAAAPVTAAADLAAAYALLARFERTPYYAPIFDAILAELAPPGVASLAAPLGEAWAAGQPFAVVHELLARYFAALPPGAEPQRGSTNPPDPAPAGLLTAAQAAAALGLSLVGFRRYVYVLRVIAPVSQIGRTLLFDPDDVARIARDYQPAGRLPTPPI